MGSQALGLSQASAVPDKCVEALKQVRTLRLLHFTRWHTVYGQVLRGMLTVRCGMGRVHLRLSD